MGKLSVMLNKINWHVRENLSHILSWSQSEDVAFLTSSQLMLIWRKRISQKVVAIDPTVTLLVLSVAIEERGRGGGRRGGRGESHTYDVTK